MCHAKSRSSGEADIAMSRVAISILFLASPCGLCRPGYARVCIYPRTQLLQEDPQSRPLRSRSAYGIHHVSQLLHRHPHLTCTGTTTATVVFRLISMVERSPLLRVVLDHVDL